VKDRGRFIESGFPVDFQLKGTSVAAFDGDRLKYDLNVRNYDLIVTRPPTATPYFLFLVCFGSDADGWVAEGRERLILNASAFWWTFSGVRADNAVSVRVEISRANRLSSGVMERMLMASREQFFR
jgi:hypothetical protein